MKAADDRLIREPIFRLVFTFALPLGIATAFHGLFNCVDLLIVARIGPGAFGAVSVASIINMVAMLLWNGCATAIATRASTAAGARRGPELAVVERVAKDLTIGASIVLGVGFYLAAGPLVRILGADANTETNARVYLEIMSLGSPTMFYLMTAASSLRARGDAKWAAWALIVANVLNIPLDIWMVFGGPGCPALGVAGAAWATVIARAVGCVIAWCGVRIVTRRFDARLEGGRTIDPAQRRSVAVAVLREGITSAAQFSVRVIGVFLMHVFIALSYIDVKDSHQALRDIYDGVGLCIRLETIIAFFALGMGTAAGAIVGQSLGAADRERARNAGRTVAFASIVIAFGLSAGLFIFKDPVFRLLAPRMTDRATAAAADYLGAMAAFFAPMAGAIVYAQAMNGRGDFKRPFLIDAVFFGVLAPIAFLCLTPVPGSYGRGFFALGVAHLCAAVVYDRVYVRGDRGEPPAQ